MTTTAPPLTDEQAAAIGTRHISVALSAGAGCGKTFVLTERYLAQLDPAAPGTLRPDELGQLVAITFTDRAAREMRDRIRRKCYDRLAAAPREQARYWQSLLRALDSARVSTIHSFCASLLRAHAVEAGLDPSFSVMEQSQASTLAAEVIDDGLRERLSTQDEPTISLAEVLGLARLKTCILRLLESGQVQSNNSWHDVLPEDQIACWAEFHERQIVPLLMTRVGGSPHARQVLDILRHAEVSHPEMQTRKAALLDMLPDLSSGSTGAGKLQALRNATMIQGAGGKKAWDDPEIYESYKAAVKVLREEIDRALKNVAFDPQAALPAAAAGLCLFRLAAEVAGQYERAKTQSGLLDFNDLMIRAQRLLTSPDHEHLRRRVSDQIKLLLVDEFQDTDPLQVELVTALCGDGVATGKLFFVGDFKQSIYRFRGADPHVFRELEAATPPEGRLPLTLNFRSQPAILDFVNALFCESFGDGYLPLRAHKQQISTPPAVEFLWALDDGSKWEGGATERMRRQEADWIARRIRGMLESAEPLVWDETAEHDTPAARAAKPGDFAILFRALSDVQYYEEALRNYGIDYYLVGGHAFYAQQEIFDLTNLLRTIADPADGISLAGVLRSPFFSLTDEALFWLGSPDGLTRRLFASPLPVELDDESRRRAVFASNVLRDLRAVKDRMPVADLINEALAKTGYDAVLLAEFLGVRKLANLRKLMDAARSFDRSGVFGLSDFIVQLSQFVAEQPREPLAATHPESMNVVRLMTIHQAKGLEFPIVVVPDLDRRSYNQPPPVEFHEQLGPLVKPDKDVLSTGYDMAQLTGRAEDEAELARLFYVACTRAADYLILSSGIRDLENPAGPWAKLLAQRFSLDTGECVAALPAGAARPRVHVTSEMPQGTPSSATSNRSGDLARRVQKAIDMAEQGQGELPRATGPIAVDAAARRQYSFSRLTGELHRTNPVNTDSLADSLPVPPSDPKSFGTLTHAILEHAEFHRGASHVRELAMRFAPKCSEQPEQDAPLASELVERFLDSPRAAQLAASDEVYRELEFLLAWPHVGQEVFLQGYIDCLYRNGAGRWIVLDYKTNNVSASQLHQTAAAYEMQLYVYAMAVEQALGDPPQQLVLRFLRPGEEVIFNWNEDAKRRAQAWVNQRIADCGLRIAD